MKTEYIYNDWVNHYYPQKYTFFKGKEINNLNR